MFAVTISDVECLDEAVAFLSKCRAPVVFLECPKDCTPRDMSKPVRVLREVARIILTPITSDTISHYSAKRYASRIDHFAACFHKTVMAIEAAASYNSPEAGTLVLKKMDDTVRMLKKEGVPSLVSYKWDQGGVASMVPWVRHFWDHSVYPDHLYFIAGAEPKRFDWDVATNVVHNLLPSAHLGMRGVTIDENKVAAQINKYYKLFVDEQKWRRGVGFDLSYAIKHPHLLEALAHYGKG